jgi:predicted NBD/HSP70 family sugar kinase
MQLYNARNGAKCPDSNWSRSQVLEAVQQAKLVSRSQLARRVPISRATVSAIIAELIAAGILEEVGEGVSSGGRRPINLRYLPSSRSAVGVVLFDNCVQAVLTNMDGNLLKSAELPMQALAPDHMLMLIRDAVRQVIADVPFEQVLGMGVGVPGVVDTANGVIDVSTSLGWLSGGTKVKEYLESSLNLPVYVHNRSKVAALAENKIGVARGVEHMLYVFLGKGIVAGTVLHGEPYYGYSASAGEVGHISVCPDGPLCKCGNRGCLEVYGSEAAIVASARALAKEHPDSLLNAVGATQIELLTVDNIIQAARQADPYAIQVLAEAGEKIGFAVGTLINLFNPQMVVIGGPVGCRAGELLTGPIIKEARRRSVARAFSSVKIVPGVLGDEGVAIGAAVLAISSTPIQDILRLPPIRRTAGRSRAPAAP